MHVAGQGSFSSTTERRPCSPREVEADGRAFPRPWLLPRASNPASGPGRGLRSAQLSAEFLQHSSQSDKVITFRYAFLGQEDPLE